MRCRTLRVLAATLLALGLALPAVAAEELPPGDECVGEDNAHPPISITEDHGPSGFTWTNPTTGEDEIRPGSGVVAGDGSEEDPFVIEGWCLTVLPVNSAATSVAGVAVWHTESHVVVRDNEISGASARSEVDGGCYFIFVCVPDAADAAVEIWDAANVTVEDNAVAWTDFGMQVTSSEAVTIAGNSVTGSDRAGIRLTDVERVVLEGNSFTGNQSDGIRITDSTDVVVAENSAVGNGRDGVWVRDTDGLVIRANLLTDNAGGGVQLRGSLSQPVVVGNTITDNDRSGIALATLGSAMPEDTRIEANEIATNREGVDVGVRAPGTVLRANNIHSHPDGVGLDAASAAEQVDARGNWWGCSAGPGASACDGVVGNAVHDPWLTEPNPAAGRGDDL